MASINLNAAKIYLLRVRISLSFKPVPFPEPEYMFSKSPAFNYIIACIILSNVSRFSAPFVDLKGVLSSQIFNLSSEPLQKILNVIIFS